jgi:hypothetical protein
MSPQKKNENGAQLSDFAVESQGWLFLVVACINGESCDEAAYGMGFVGFEKGIFPISILCAGCQGVKQMTDSQMAPSRYFPSSYINRVLVIYSGAQIGGGEPVGNLGDRNG